LGDDSSGREFIGEKEGRYCILKEMKADAVTLKFLTGMTWNIGT
jgi:hypothetical protein